MESEVSNVNAHSRERWSDDQALSQADGALMSLRHLAKAPDDPDGMALRPIIDIPGDLLSNLRGSRGCAS